MVASMCLGGEAQVEHQRHRRRVAGFGGMHDRAALGLGQAASPG
jgi:hypothetical protein